MTDSGPLLSFTPLAESQRPWRGRWPQPKSPSLFREGLGEGFELGTRVSPSPSPSPQSCHHSQIAG